MARITYDNQTAAAFKAVREVPRDGLGHWRDAIRRHLHPIPGMTVADIGAGTGAFATALRDWFDLPIRPVEPSAAMRAQIPRQPGIEVLAGAGVARQLPDGAADGAWLSLVIHHLPDLEAAAREIRRVLRPGGLVLIRQGFPGRLAGAALRVRLAVKSAGTGADSAFAHHHRIRVKETPAPGVGGSARRVCQTIRGRRRRTAVTPPA
jgi:SAM-dependent methyltransferase